MWFDLDGKNGNYFRAQVWQWRALLEELATLDVLTSEDIRRMSFNDSYLVTDEKAKALADALDGKYPDEFPRIALDPDPDLHVHGDLLCGDRDCGMALEPYYMIEADRVKEFVAFCRASGGFYVS